MAGELVCGPQNHNALGARGLVDRDAGVRLPRRNRRRARRAGKSNSRKSQTRKLLDGGAWQSGIGIANRRAARRGGRTLLVALGVFAGACALGGRWPLGAAWLHVLPASLAVAVVWLGAQLVVWSASRSAPLKSAFATLHALWFYGAGAGCAVLLLLRVPLASLLPGAYYFSPWTLWLLLRDPDLAANPLFWRAIAAHAALIIAGAWLLWRRRHDAPLPVLILNSHSSPAPTQKQTAPKSPARSGAHWPERAREVAALAVASSHSAARQSVPAATATKLARKPLPPPQWWMKRVLDWAGRFDNPLLILELRRALLNLNLPTVAAWSNGAMAFVCLVYLPLKGLLDGAFAPENWMMVLSVALSGLVVAPLIGLEGAANAYDRDRLDGSLQMLFLTPRTEAEIAWGKLGPTFSNARCCC